jgi:hypothetical protein
VIAAATPAAARYTRDWVAVGACTPSAAHAAPDLDARFVAVTWTLTCPSLGAELDLDLSAFFTADSRHEAIVRVDGRDPIVVRSSTPRWSIPVGDQKFPWGWWVVIPGAVLGLGGVMLLRRRAT